MNGQDVLCAVDRTGDITTTYDVVRRRAPANIDESLGSVHFVSGHYVCECAPVTIIIRCPVKEFQ